MTRFSCSILNIKRTFAHLATIIRSIQAFLHSFLRSFCAVYEEVWPSSAKVSTCYALSCLFTICFPPIGWLSDTCEMPSWHLVRGGIQKSIARMQAHFSLPCSSRWLCRLAVVAPLPLPVIHYPKTTSEPAHRLTSSQQIELTSNPSHMV